MTRSTELMVLLQMKREGYTAVIVSSVGLISESVMAGHNELWWGYVWNSMQVKIPIRTAVVGWPHSHLWSNVATARWWMSCVCSICVMFMCLVFFVFLCGCGGRLSALQSVLSPCLEVMNTWLNGSRSDRVTNDVTLIDAHTQGHAFPFLAWCLN